MTYAVILLFILAGMLTAYLSAWADTAPGLWLVATLVIIVASILYVMHL